MRELGRLLLLALCTASADAACDATSSFIGDVDNFPVRYSTFAKTACVSFDPPADCLSIIDGVKIMVREGLEEGEGERGEERQGPLFRELVPTRQEGVVGCCYSH